MSKREVIEELKAARASLLDAIAGLPDEALLRVGAVGVWSVKDVLAHLTAWESELVTALSKLDAKRAPAILDIEDIDDWNAEQYRISAPRPLAAVLEDFAGVHKHLLRAVEDLDERTLTDNRRFPWMEGEPLSYLVAENATWHEQEHADEIRAWRADVGL